ncbi:MAG: A24 family peptidase [Alphaproteobacteria bacterium]|nr:A24 family peptidase [Alphaproteobacteria bacterium]
MILWFDCPPGIKKHELEQRPLAMMEILFLSGLGAGLGAAALIDARTQRIPDAVNICLAALGLALALLEERGLEALLGGAFGYGMIWGVNALYRARRGRDGIGMGDAKLLAAGGVWVGWFGVPFVVLIASSVAIAVIAVRRLQGHRIGPTDRIAFGPALAFGVFAVALVIRLAEAV